MWMETLWVERNKNITETRTVTGLMSYSAVHIQKPDYEIQMKQIYSQLGLRHTFLKFLVVFTAIFKRNFRSFW